MGRPVSVPVRLLRLLRDIPLSLAKVSKAALANTFTTEFSVLKEPVPWAMPRSKPLRNRRTGNDSFVRTAAHIILSALLLNGCATMQLPDYPVPPAKHSGQAVTKDGLTLAAEPITDKKELKKYFGVDLLSADILPIYVVAENNSGDSSFVLMKDKFSVNSPESGSQVGSETGGQVVLITASLLISVPLLFVGTKMISDATVIKHNFKVKELQQDTISPGKRKGGFIYSRVPQGDMPQSLNLHLEALDLATRETKSFDFIIDAQRR